MANVGAMGYKRYRLIWVIFLHLVPVERPTGAGSNYVYQIYWTRVVQAIGKDVCA